LDSEILGQANVPHRFAHPGNWRAFGSSRLYRASSAWQRGRNPWQAGQVAIGRGEQPKAGSSTSRRTRSISNAAPAHHGISITNASYGAGNDNRMEVTSLLRSTCNGKESCEFQVTNQFFGHDPIVGVHKDVIISWTCGSARTSTFGEYSTAQLSC
jgi:hypothetical protein